MDAKIMDYEMKMGTKEYNDKFSEFWHFKNHPQMVPFVGCNWGKSKKLLIVGESHYLDPDFNIDTIREWYDISLADLDDDDFDYAYWWTNTARLVDDVNDHPTKYPMWNSIQKAIHETGFKPDNINVFSFLSYMNFFQRPAEHTAAGIVVSEEDKKIGNETMKYIIDIIKPDYIFFVSSLAWKNFDKNIFPKEKVGHSAHPQRQWWNMKSSKFTMYEPKKIVTGKESFMDFITHEQIFK